MLVMISCMYGQGCSETSRTYIASDVQLQESLKYAESQVISNFNPDVLATSGMLVAAMSGNDIQTPLTSHVNLKGNIKWATAGLSYSYNF